MSGIRETDNKDVDQDYEEPNVADDAAQIPEDVNDQYMELEVPQFTGYKNQLPN